MRSHNHPCWQIFVHNASCFNEESGEVCFSVLARGIAGSGVRSNCEAVASKFRLVKTKIDVAEDLKFDLCGDDFAVKRHRRIKSTSTEVMTTITFFQRMIRNLLRRRHRTYEADCGFLGATARRNQSERKTVPAEVVPRLHSDVKTSFDLLVPALDRTLNQFWPL